MDIIRITKTKLPFGWLSNMSRFQISFLNKTFNSTEALFQAMRFADEDIREAIRIHESPMGAKNIAKENSDKMVIEPRGIQDVNNMRCCIRLKVRQHPELKQKLIDTKDARIIEDVTKRGPSESNLFWGAMETDNGWEGKSVLGELWMELREELKDE